VRLVWIRQLRKWLGHGMRCSMSMEDRITVWLKQRFTSLEKIEKWVPW
jgi:hypothetical protein